MRHSSLSAHFRVWLLAFASMLFSAGAPLYAQDAPVRFGVLSILPPAEAYALWQPVVDYLAEQTDQPISLVLPRGFKKLRDDIDSQKIDFFYINSFIYYRLKQQGKAAAMVQIQNPEGRTTSNSVIFVRTDSGITSLDQLKGESMAFISPLAAGGYLAPRALAYSEGLQSDKETKEIFTKNLSTSVHKVLLGEAKAGTMCGFNYKLMDKKIGSGELRILATSSDYPDALIAARSDFDPAIRKNLEKALLNMSDNADGKAIIAKMHNIKVQKFVPYDEAIEELTKAHIKAAGME